MEILDEVRMAIPVPSVCLSKGARGKALELMCGAGVHDPGACPLHVRCPLGHEMAAKAESHNRPYISSDWFSLRLARHDLLEVRSKWFLVMFWPKRRLN
eukprot:5514227-Amphidinium_carterae.1